MILFRYSSGDEVRHDSRVEEEIYKLDSYKCTLYLKTWDSIRSSKN